MAQQSATRTVPRKSLRTPGTETPVLDRSKTAVAILLDSAEAMADGLIAVAEISPDGWVLANNVPVPGNTPSTGGFSVTFPCNGFIVAISASCQDGTPLSNSSTSLRVQQNGDTDVFQAANGGGAGFLPLITFALGGGTQKLRRRFEQATQWQFYLQNVQGSQVICDIGFAYVNTSNPRV
jgi:hypothetical protein